MGGRADEPRKSGRSKGRRLLASRSLATLAVLPFAHRLPAYARLTAELVSDPRVPIGRKAVLAGIVGYTLAPVDLIPDRIPLVGVLDDFVLALLGFELFLDGIPDEVLEPRLEALGIPRELFDEDRGRIRRAVPKPLRRVIMNIPTMVESAGRAARGLGVGDRVRVWLKKEESPA